MSISLSAPEPMVLNPEDFDPPLKRKEPSVPYYWTLDEIATELGVTARKVQYDVKGNPQRNTPPKLKAYQAGMAFLVPESDALEYIWQYRQRKQKS
jgi:hypothetical protein